MRWWPLLAASVLCVQAVAPQLSEGISTALRPRPFSSTSPWNTPTPLGTKWFDTDLLHHYNGGPLHWWVNNSSAVVWYGRSTDPVWTYIMPAINDPVLNRHWPASTFRVRAPKWMRDGGDSDHINVLVYGGRYYETWLTNIDPVRRVVRATVWARGNITYGPGAGTRTTSDGVRASNFSWAGGLITGSDIRRGSISHALAVALPGHMLSSAYRSNIWPATAWDTGGSWGPIRMGTRIGIPRGVAMPAGLSSVGRLVFRALQNYGAFVGDFAGGSWPVFYADKNSVAEYMVAPLFQFWDRGGSADMEKIGPLLRVANYQP